MKKSALLFRRNERRVAVVDNRPTRDSIAVSRIPVRLEDWVLECNAKCQSETTNNLRRQIVRNLVWYLRQEGHTSCGEHELRRFLSYLMNGHESGTRWGNSQVKTAPRPSTLKTYHAHLSVFFKWLVRRKDIDVNPMDSIDAPKVPKDQIQPFVEDQILALRHAARKSAYPHRDEAILLLLLDTGIRAQELCMIRQCDLNLDQRRVTVIGKGNKLRTVVFGVKTARAISEYLTEELGNCEEPSMPLFVSDRGKLAGGGLTRSGLRQLFERWNERARLQNVRCSPHTCRHTFAINFLRAGGQLLVLQQMLGHEDLKMCAKYVKLAQSDLENMARPFSPMDRLGRKGK